MAGFYAPAGMPADIRTRLVGACKDASTGGAKFRAVTGRLGQDISYLGPETWRDRITRTAGKTSRSSSSSRPRTDGR